MEDNRHGRLLTKRRPSAGWITLRALNRCLRCSPSAVSNGRSRSTSRNSRTCLAEFDPSEPERGTCLALTRSKQNARHLYNRAWLNMIFRGGQP